jgi:hypothetical protein
MAADMAATLSSSTPCGRAEAIVSPSTLITAEASISGEDACISLKCSTMSWERDFVNSILPIYADNYMFDDPINHFIDVSLVLVVTGMRYINSMNWVQ